MEDDRDLQVYAALINWYTVGSSDFDIFLDIQYASCVFGLALKS